MSIRSWISRVWPRPTDVLGVNVSGERRRIEAFLVEHSIEFGNVRIEGKRMTFRAYVPKALLDTLRKYADVKVTANISDEGRRIRILDQVGRGNRFAKKQSPPGVGRLIS